jgi:acyl carrier protein
MQQIEQDVRQYIVETFLFGDDNHSLGDDDSLLEKGVVDSTGVLELVAFVEQQFQVQIKDMELVPENLDSISRIARFVQRKRQA